jgi:NADP-dependent 3-hydroxy acid dehydrogenase YdfG
MRLRRQIAVVTGASAGIGQATALALASEGASVVCAARRTGRLADIVAEIEAIGGEALAVTADVATEDGVEDLFEAATTHFGRVDILVNNVGVASYKPLIDTTIEEYDWMMNTNMRSTFLCTKAFLPPMLERGSGQVCFVGSVAGMQGFPNEAVYNATKFAQMGFAQAIDHETREHGVKVSVVAPGGVNTEFAIGTGRTEGDPMLDRFLDPEDVAAAVVFALTQPEKARTFLIGMRPMSEPR